MEHLLQRPVKIGNGLKTNIPTIRLEKNRVGIVLTFLYSRLDLRKTERHVPRGYTQLIPTVRGKDSDAVCWSDDVCRSPESVSGWATRDDASLITCGPGVDPIFIDNAVEDFKPAPGL